MDLSLFNTIYYKVFLVGFSMFILGKTRQFKKYYKTFAYCFVGILIFIAGFRWNIGTDWNNYYLLFKSIFWNNITSKKFAHYDFGYRLFNVVIRTFTDSYTIFLIILSAVAVILVYIALRLIDADVLLGLLILYANYFIVFYFGSNRMILALGFALMGMTSIYYKNINKAFLYGLTSFLMHKASVFIWVTFWIPKKIIKFSKLVVLFLISFIVGYNEITVKILNIIINLTVSIDYMGISKLALKARYYIDEKVGELGAVHFMLGATKRIAVCFFLYWIYKSFANKEMDKFEYFFNIYALSICVYFIFNGLGVFQVFSTYLAVTEIAVWGTLYNNLKIENRFFLAVAIFILYTLEILSAFPVYRALYIPYKTIWG